MAAYKSNSCASKRFSPEYHVRVFSDDAQLARAGFFYKPKSSTPDNTTCYLCHSNLDGWEKDDDAIGEHIKLSPGCGWATIARIEQDIDGGNQEQENPMGDSLLNARKMTFGAMWPHESKRGWLCKTQKVLLPPMVSNVQAEVFRIS